ncbi:MAG: SDR family oxidoreductase [Spirochaetes bacterium]|nr:SDR family oxidoreductase [Spirochaetota bacterium]
MKRFDGKIVYITGGSSGIGLETAKLFASLGAGVVLIARNEAKLEEAAGKVSSLRRSESQTVGTVSADVGDDAEVRRKMADAVARFGAPDILVNSAGINKYADRFENITAAEFDEVMRINCSGVRNVTAALLDRLKEKRGRVVILSSVAGLFGMFGYTAYGASKAALVGFAESLGYELRPLGMSVTLVCPPEVDTPMNLDEAKRLPREGRAVKGMGGFLMPDYVARVIVKAAAKRRFFVIPGFSTRFLYRLHRYSNGLLSRIISDAVIRKSRKRDR